MFGLFRLSFWRRKSPDTRSGRPLGDHPPARPKLGLALSCGGARALAHVGVLEVLEEEGIEIHAIAGSSMGAYIGALWAAGFSGKQLGELRARIVQHCHQLNGRASRGRRRSVGRCPTRQAFWITTARELRYASIASGPPSEP